MSLYEFFVNVYNELTNSNRTIYMLIPGTSLENARGKLHKELSYYGEGLYLMGVEKARLKM